MTSTPRAPKTIDHFKVRSWSKTVDDERFFDDAWHFDVEACQGMIALDFLRIEPDEYGKHRSAKLWLRPNDIAKIVVALQQTLRRQRMEDNP